MVQDQDQQSENSLNTDAEIPVAKVSPMLKWSIIIMSGAIVIILVVIISTIIYRAVKLGDRGSSTKTYSAKGFGSKDLVVSKGAKIGGVTLYSNKMSVVIKHSTGGDEIVLIDTRSGDVTGRIKLKEK